MGLVSIITTCCVCARKMCEPVCVCVKERERERKRKRECVRVRAFLPKNGEIALWPSTNGSIARLLVWVTILNVRQSRLYLYYWYRYVSPPKPSRELKYWSDWNIVQLNLIIGLISFLWKTILGARQRGATRRSSRAPSGQVHIPGVRVISLFVKHNIELPFIPMLLHA